MSEDHPSPSKRGFIIAAGTGPTGKVRAGASSRLQGQGCGLGSPKSSSVRSRDPPERPVACTCNNGLQRQNDGPRRPCSWREAVVQVTLSQESRAQLATSPGVCQDRVRAMAFLWLLCQPSSVPPPTSHGVGWGWVGAHSGVRGLGGRHPFSRLH